VEFVRARSEPYEALRQETHLRVGEHLEREAATSPWIETAIEAGHHLFEAGEYDRAYELLGACSVRLRQWGQVTAELALLEPFLEESVRGRLSADRHGRLLGTVGLAYADLGQAEKAIEF